MIEVRLTEEQANRIKQSPDLVRLCDPHGHLLGLFRPEITEAALAELKRRARSPGPWYTGDQLNRRLDALQEERDRAGRLDDNRVADILKHMDETDPGEMRSGA